ncbi:VPA1267 family protein [Paraburkholderia sp. BL9I2N2]|uniref:VPA1267 family protein n=1 Tax=Paraburkholderia sp. BL9I2N2 TaxID=1938809 RepID=UPI001045B233|nr:VPA1267 family protein [Paraburkholderia sp. BL9I2N2]TCK96777.1 hypothetical protein B0G74_3470 [Paraburkholderia sp. BL9I2N2]
MASGKQLAEQYVGVFSVWVASKSDADFRQIVIRGVLSRTEIARECGFAKSVLSQNPRIKDTLRVLEDELRSRGVLPEAANPADEPHEVIPMREPSHHQAVRDAESLRRLQSENASQKAEIADLRQRLAKYEALHEALVLTGRLPR